jgi:hypothetical protein
MDKMKVKSDAAFEVFFDEEVKKFDILTDSEIPMDMRYAIRQALYMQMKSVFVAGYSSAYAAYSLELLAIKSKQNNL